jgi:hypothetical protein
LTVHLSVAAKDESVGSRGGAAGAGGAGGGNERWRTSRLSLIDLAGSERVAQSQVEGREFREATHVNRSLLALGAVLSALANKSPHVPYRSSRLTWELREALSRNAHMSIIGHINRYVYTSYIYISYQPLLIYIYCIIHIIS